MRVYLDNCCYNRPFDDQGQLRVRMETEAKLLVQALMRTGEYEMNREPRDYTKWREAHFDEDGESIHDLAEKIKAFKPRRIRLTPRCESGCPAVAREALQGTSNVCVCRFCSHHTPGFI